jgi:hypothetical protein
MRRSRKKAVRKRKSQTDGRHSNRPACMMLKMSPKAVHLTITIPLCIGALYGAHELVGLIVRLTA